MSTLYWITVLGNLGQTLKGFFLLSIAGIVVVIVAWPLISDDDTRKRWAKKLTKYCLYGSFLGLLACVFIPSKTELYLIYGIGSTMDYLKENPTAKQLPDKFVKAIDKWADSLAEEQKKDSTD